MFFWWQHPLLKYTAAFFRIFWGEQVFSWFQKNLFSEQHFLYDVFAVFMTTPEALQG